MEGWKERILERIVTGEGEGEREIVCGGDSVGDCCGGSGGDGGGVWCLSPFIFLSLLSSFLSSLSFSVWFFLFVFGFL